MPDDQDLVPDGVEIVDLTPHCDARGILIELFRETWRDDIRPCQWNAVQSNKNVLRGFHAHWRHNDYLLVVSGSMLLGLKDLRYGSPSFGRSAKVQLDSRAPSAIFIPPGIGHAFYFPEPSIHIYAVTEYWDLADELGCRWDAPGLDIDWGFDNPILSARDEQLPDLEILMTTLNEKLSDPDHDK